MRRRRKFHSFEAVSDVMMEPLVVNIEEESERNFEFRKPFWTGEYIKVVLMNIPVGGEIGIEMHEDFDQFIRIESGRANVLFGRSAEDFYYQRLVDDDYAIMIPAGTWHNIVNLGREPLKLYSVYAPVSNLPTGD